MAESYERVEKVFFFSEVFTSFPLNGAELAGKACVCGSFAFLIEMKNERECRVWAYTYTYIHLIVSRLTAYAKRVQVEVQVSFRFRFRFQPTLQNFRPG